MSVYILSFSIIHIFSVREKEIGENIHNEIQAYIYTAFDFDSSSFCFFFICENKTFLSIHFLRK